MIYDDILDSYYEMNKKKLSVLSEEARKIVVYFSQNPLQQKHIVIEEIKFLMEKAAEEDKIYYEEAINFIQNM